MKVLKHGSTFKFHDYVSKTYRATCHNCGCEYEFRGTEIIEDYYGELRLPRCPECNTPVPYDSVTLVKDEEEAEQGTDGEAK